MPLNLFLSASGESEPGDDTGRPPRRGESAARTGRRRSIQERPRPWWAADGRSPVLIRRTVQTLCLGLFLVLFLYVIGPHGSPPFAEARSAREFLPPNIFLALDPLLSISTAIAARMWVPSLVAAGIILLTSVIVPRGFCAYVCPLGTVIDLCDRVVGRRGSSGNAPKRGWWVHLKYYILVAVLLCAASSVLLSGFVAAIPVLTRGMASILGPLQVGLWQGWHRVPGIGVGQCLSIVLFLTVVGLGFLRPRFWCRYVCPTGALFSIAGLLRLTGRKVSNACIECGRCVAACPFDAIKADFTTRSADCTFCRTCAGVCPVGAISFGRRWGSGDTRPATVPLTGEVALSRRGLLVSGLAGLAVAAGRQLPVLARADASPEAPAIRPPGSIPEETFLRVCIRCGECLQACPTKVLQPTGLESGLLRLWTPRAVPDWAGCDPTCNNCGQACPTGAIRSLPMEEKRVVRMGLAIVNEDTCLPHSGREACQMCVDECGYAGYDAIEFLRVHVSVDEDGLPLEDSGLLAPVILAEKCVGCGLCQSRCYAINVRERGVLSESAVQVLAGDGREDRMRGGSYLKLREEERRAREQARQDQRQEGQPTDTYLPDFLR